MSGPWGLLLQCCIAQDFINHTLQTIIYFVLYYEIDIFFFIVLISNHLFFNSLTKTGIIYNDSFPLLLIFIISLINNFSISVCWRMYQSTITKNVDLSDHVSLFLCIIIFIYTHISIWLHVQWSRDTVFRRTYFWFEFILLIVIKRIGEKF